MRRAPYLLALFSVLLSSVAMIAQDMEQDERIIFLRNPSFEDMPRNSAPPLGWTDCGFPGETPPDVHPDPKFEFSVRMQAFHGKTYLGMVTRENETYESVGQLLSQPMEGGQCYVLQIHLARSSVYLSRSRLTGQPSNYVEPIRLRVFGGYSICDKGEEIGGTGPISNYKWSQYRIKLEPDADYTHLILQAYYPKATLIPSNGNIILDNAQPLMPIECDQDPSILDTPAEEMITLIDPETKIVPRSVTPRGTAPAPKPPVLTQPKERQNTVVLGTTKAFLKEGEVFAVENINFKPDSPEIEESSEPALQEIVGFLRQNNNLIVEIGGHASALADSGYAKTLSKNRAESVVEYLKKHSIPWQRLIARGYGKTRPVCMDKDPECHRRNQRVEVKILKLKQSR
ncbi:MAG: OmpA family protein [Bacteroidota bacterium]